MVVWLKSSLVLLFLMTETSEELKKQTVKIIEGQPVVLGPKFAEREDNFASDVPPDKNFLEASRDYFLEKYYDVKGFIKKEIVLDKEFFGVVITPLDTHLMSAIIGLYFGGSLVKK